MNSYAASPKFKASGYYLTVIRNEDGDILELRILKNSLTKWFAMDIGLYLLSRGAIYSFSSVIIPVLKVYSEGGTNYWALDEQVPIHKVSIFDQCGGGFGSFTYLVSSEPIALGPPRVCATPNCPRYKINIVDNGNALQFHEYVGNAPIEHIRIPIYTSLEKTLVVSASDVVCSVQGNYQFTSSFECKYILAVSGGKFATFTYNEQNELKYSCANILSFRPFRMRFEAGMSISLSWRVRLV